MFKFGSTGITTGYIKQLLATFQLPKALIYTDAHERYFEAHGQESPYLLETCSESIHNTSSNERKLPFSMTSSFVPYIKDGKIQFYTCGYYTGEVIDNDTTRYFDFIPGKWQPAPFNLDKAQGGWGQHYERGEPIQNLTKTFQIKNNIYDSATHEYLGEYLRFIRDYDGINLMPLYNCFSNNRPILAEPLIIKKDDGSEIILNPQDPNYKIYSLPVTLFQNYTIAIDSDYPVELFCGFCSKNLVNTNNTDLIKETFVRVNNCQFNTPFLYTKLTDLAVPRVSKKSTNDEFIQHAKRRNLLASVSNTLRDLRLFIKTSSKVDSSIVVLEGDYRSWNDSAAIFQEGRPMVKKTNHTVLANESIFSELPFDLISPLQLLQVNTRVQTPFADRLLEYLLDQCVTGGDQEVRENVLMAQHLAGLRYQGHSLVRTYPRKEVLDVAGKTELSALTDAEKIKVTPTAIKYDEYNGIWSEALRRLFYRYMSTRTDFSNTPDLLGYVDKDVENSFVAVVTNKEGKKIKKTMISFDAWEDVE